MIALCWLITNVVEESHATWMTYAQSLCIEPINMNRLSFITEG
jgi:hypothetical protein